MNEIENTYIKSQILSMPMKLNQELIYQDKTFNKHTYYADIIEYVDNFLEGNNINRFLVLPGIRDVGKTTLLYQVYEYLLKEKGINPQNILYFSCERLKKIGNVDIFNVINFYVKTYHNSIIETLPNPVFVLIDEAQYDENWALNGKLIFDATKNIFMIFSGSSALNLSYNADAARRLLNIPIYPLSYSQHLKLKYGNFKNDISNSIIDMIFNGNVENTNELETKIINTYSNFQNYNLSEWKNFLEFGGFPYSFYQNTNDITKKIVNMVDKVVKTDMNTIESINSDTQYLAFQILNYLAYQNASKGFLSNHFDAKIALVTKILNILEKTQLIFHIEAYTSSVKRTTKPHKYFFATSSLKHNLALDIGIATLKDDYVEKLLKTYVASRFHNLNYKIYYDDNKKKNVDFIVQRGLEKPIPIEVCPNKSQIKHAINRYNSPHGIIISNTTQNVVKEDNIIYLPSETFAFM